MFVPPVIVSLLTVLNGSANALANNVAPTSSLAAATRRGGENSLMANKKVCISGGGPCGIYLATLLIQQEPTVQITILEKAVRGGNNVNAFGIGLGSRLLKSLDAVPGLRQGVESVGAGVGGFGIKIVSRADLSERMTSFLEEADTNGQCQIMFGEGCADINLDDRRVTTTSGHEIDYDLLIGADGINSMVRKKLVDERGIKEEHYLEPSRWKALRLPPQPDIENRPFKPLQHPTLRGGRVLPRYPEGHILLSFWDEESGKDNPGNANTADDLKALFTDAMQDDAPKKRSLIFRRFLGASKGMNMVGRKRIILFDDEAVELFLKTRPNRSHYMKIDRFHDDCVALVGDAAHGMNSLLGQGCACGLKSAEVLAECLLGKDLMDINEVLQSYSKRALPEAHAVTDLNLVAALLRAGPIFKVLMVPLIKRISDPDVSYEQILKENRLVIALSRSRWKRSREPLVRTS